MNRGQIHMRLPREVEAVLQRLVQRTGLSRAQVVRNAILRSGWLEEQRAEGRRVVSRGDDGERELAWP